MVTLRRVKRIILLLLAGEAAFSEVYRDPFRSRFKASTNIFHALQIISRRSAKSLELTNFIHQVLFKLLF
jgi:hypothetical protein